MEILKNLGSYPQRVFGDSEESSKKLRVRITKEISSDSVSAIDLVINMSIFDLSALVQVCLENGYLLIVLGYGNSSVSK